MKKCFYVFALAAIIALVGCKKSEPQGSAPEAPKAAAAPVETPAPAAPPVNIPAVPEIKTEPVDPNAAAATVNGTVITEGQIEEKIAPRLKSMEGRVPQQYQAEMKKNLHDRALEAMIVEQLLDEKVKEKGIVISDANVETELTRQMKEQNMSEEDFKKVLGMYGLDINQLRNQIRRGMGYQQLMEGQFASKVDVNEADAKAYYEQNVSQFTTPEQVQASHILISTKSTDPNADPNKVKAEAKAKAEMVLGKVKAADANFAALAKEYSSCPSAQKGGDLGMFGKGQMVKPFEDAAFSMKVGETSGIVETDFGYHIIKVTGHSDANTASFEAKKTDIVEQLSNQKKQQLAQEYIKSLKDSAKIEYAKAKEVIAPAADANAQAKPAEANKPANIQ